MDVHYGSRWRSREVPRSSLEGAVAAQQLRKHKSQLSTTVVHATKIFSNSVKTGSGAKSKISRCRGNM